MTSINKAPLAELAEDGYAWAPRPDAHRPDLDLTCRECGAVVAVLSQTQHTKWHTQAPAQIALAEVHGILRQIQQEARR